MRILVVIPGDGAGSSMIFARQEAESLRGLGIDVQEFYLKSRTNPAILWLDSVSLRRSITTFRPDIVHVHYGTLSAALTTLLSPRPVVITFRGSDLNLPTYGLRECVAHLLSQFAALRAERIVCVSSRLASRLWWRHSATSVIPGGVDTEFFRPQPMNVARRQLKWSLSKKYVLFNAGNNPRVKRLDLAQEAVNIAQQRLDEIELHVINGDRPSREIPTLLNASDCLLVTSDFEGSPTIVKEAIACGTPIVSVDVGDVTERLAGVQPAELVERNPEKIADGLLRVLSRGERTNGPLLTTAFSTQTATLAVQAVYNNILANAR